MRLPVKSVHATAPYDWLVTREMIKKIHREIRPFVSTGSVTVRFHSVINEVDELLIYSYGAEKKKISVTHSY